MTIRDTFTAFQHANKIYWGSLYTFYDASRGLLKTAMDLGFDTKPFAVAFEDVGLPKCSLSSHIFTVNKAERIDRSKSPEHPNRCMGFHFRCGLNPLSLRL